MDTEAGAIASTNGIRYIPSSTRSIPLLTTVTEEEMKSLKCSKRPLEYTSVAASARSRSESDA
eukprot:5985747-Pleurochrysis_carterae.AAC.1